MHVGISPFTFGQVPFTKMTPYLERNASYLLQAKISHKFTLALLKMDGLAFVSLVAESNYSICRLSQQFMLFKDALTFKFSNVG